MSLLKSLLELTESKNHLGERTFETFSGWKAACKKVNKAAWFDGDEDICNAFVGPRPYKRGESLAVGEWDGAIGCIFQGDAKPAEKPAEKPVDPKATPAK
jgi:hypothetical protein